VVTYGAWSKKPVLLQPPQPHGEIPLFMIIVILLDYYKTLPTVQMLPTHPTLLSLLPKPLMLGLPKENKLLLNGPLLGTKVELLLLQLVVHPLCSQLDSLKATPTNGDVKPLLSTQSELMLFINPIGYSVQSLYQ